MTIQLADRVKESSTTAGTGTFTLGGAQAGYQSFASGLTSGNATYYCVHGTAVPGEWEVGIGTFTSPSTLTRTTVLSSSNSNALVSFSAGSKDVFCTLPASQVPESNGCFLPVTGMNLTWASVTSVSVSAGSTSDSTGTKSIPLPSATTVNMAGAGLGGMDTKSMSGTSSYTNGSSNVAGVGTLFTTEFGTRVLTGTIISSTTTVTGTGTKFLSQVAVNDLIGTAAKGYYRVTAISSDTSLTITSAPASAFSGQTPNCVEQPLISISGISPQRVATITSDTALTIVVAALGTASAQPAFCGYLYLGDGTNNSFNHVFVCTDGLSTGVIFSTQRTKPFVATAYPYYKRISALVFDINANILLFRQTGGSHRETHLLVNAATNNCRVLSNGGSSTMATIKCGGIVPPTSTLVYVRGVSVGVSAIAYVRPANLPGTPPTTPTTHIWQNSGTSGYADKTVYAFTDGVQQLDYSTTVAGFYLDIGGFVEDL